MLDLPAGGVTMRPTGSARTELQLERFSSSFPVSIGELVRGVNVLRIPADRATQPWKLEVDSAAPVVVCGRR